MKKKAGMISMALSVAVFCASTAFAQHDMHGMKGMEGMDMETHATAKEKKAPKTVNDYLKSAVDSYIAIQDALAKNSISGVSDSAAQIVKSADAALGIESKKKELDQDEVLKNELTDLSKAAKKLTGEKLVLKNARKDFNALSASVINIAEGYLSAEAIKGFQKYHCGMAKGDWLQKGDKSDEARNPYLGSSMLNCGENLELKHREMPAHGNSKGLEKNKLGDKPGHKH